MIHDDLPIYRKGVELLSLAVRVQQQMPKGVKRVLGEKIMNHCVEMLDLMAFANATQKSIRVGYIQSLLSEQRAVTVLLRVGFDSRYLSPKLWGESVELLGSIGSQAGGWIKSSSRAPVA